MKIRGILNVEGVDLHVDIEAPDDVQELYVTNVHPNCIVVPRERWKVDLLGLSPATVAELHNTRIFFLGELVDQNWNFKFNGFNEQVRNEISHALVELRNAALLFEEEQPAGQMAMTKATVIPVDEETRNEVLNRDISTLGLWERQEQALREDRGVKIIKDLISVGRDRLIMTSQMNEKALQKIEDVLRRVGIELPA